MEDLQTILASLHQMEAGHAPLDETHKARDTADMHIGAPTVMWDDDYVNVKPQLTRPEFDKYLPPEKYKVFLEYYDGIEQSKIDAVTEANVLFQDLLKMHQTQKQQKEMFNLKQKVEADIKAQEKTHSTYTATIKDRAKNKNAYDTARNDYSSKKKVLTDESNTSQEVYDRLLQQIQAIQTSHDDTILETQQFMDVIKIRIAILQHFNATTKDPKRSLVITQCDNMQRNYRIDKKNVQHDFQQVTLYGKEMLTLKNEIVIMQTTAELKDQNAILSDLRIYNSTTTPTLIPATLPPVPQTKSPAQTPPKSPAIAPIAPKPLTPAVQPQITQFTPVDNTAIMTRLTDLQTVLKTKKTALSVKLTEQIKSAEKYALSLEELHSTVADIVDYGMTTIQESTLSQRIDIMKANKLSYETIYSELRKMTDEIFILEDSLVKDMTKVISAGNTTPSQNSILTSMLADISNPQINSSENASHKVLMTKLTRLEAQQKIDNTKIEKLRIVTGISLEITRITGQQNDLTIMKTEFEAKVLVHIQTGETYVASLEYLHEDTSDITGGRQDVVSMSRKIKVNQDKKKYEDLGQTLRVMKDKINRMTKQITAEIDALQKKNISHSQKTLLLLMHTDIISDTSNAKTRERGRKVEARVKALETERKKDEQGTISRDPPLRKSDRHTPKDDDSGTSWDVESAHSERAEPGPSFEQAIQDLAQRLVTHVYPPAPAAAWSARPQVARYANQDPRAALARANPDLHALCARIAHIALLAGDDNTLALAAHRFVLEIPENSRLVSRALAPQPEGGAYAARSTRAPAHANLTRIRACLDKSSLHQLRRCAEAAMRPDLVSVDDYDSSV